MKILNKFIWSKKEPSNKNDVWFDGSTWRMYTEEAWQSFTLPVDAADKVAKVIENASEVYQEKLNAGYGIIIEGNTISVDDSNVWEAIETLQQNKVEQIQLNDYVPLDRWTSTSQVLMDNISELNSTKADKTKTEQELNKKLNKTDVATINGQSLIEGGNIVIDDTEIKQQITELSEEIGGLSEEIGTNLGREIVVHEEEKVQTLRYMKIETPFSKGQHLEITLTENAATMSQGINIYRVVSASAMYIIGHFDAVGQTINVVLEDDAQGGLQFENQDAYTTYGVKVVAKSIEEGSVNKTLNHIQQDIAEVSSKIDSITEETHSINLFDKNNLVVGYIQEGNGTIYASTTSSCSALIPIQGGHYYLLSGRDNIGATGIRCLDADGNIMKVLIASTDAELSIFACPNERGTGAATNGQFKTPNNAVYVQFTAVFSGKGSVDNIMLTDLGTTYSANPSAPNYEPYGTTILVKYGAVPNPLLGKSVIFTGDSICNASTDYANGGGWAKRIGEKNGMTWVNRGISGGTITSKEAIGGYFTISETDFGNGADYIILEGGTNDADRIGSILNGEKPAAFGSWTIGDYTSDFTNDTFCGALEMMLKKVITDFPSAKVGFIIAMKMGQTGQGYTADKYNRRAYFETIIQICNKWGVPVLNLWDNCTMNPKIPSHTELYTDGQHPTGKGYDFITPIIEAWMKTL